MTPFRLGCKHARELLDTLGEQGVGCGTPIYLDRDEIWSQAGPYTWDQYLKGARSVLGHDMVRVKPHAMALPSEVAR